MKGQFQSQQQKNQDNNVLELLYFNFIASFVVSLLL